jgi:myo-inositol-1(or 4)-monophosphatase
MATFGSLFPQVADIRRTGSAALDLAYVAAGRVDGYWEIGLEKWDLAAGALIVQEAGGVVSDFVGGDNYFKSGNIVVGNLAVHKAMLAGITPHLTDDLKR